MHKKAPATLRTHNCLRFHFDKGDLIVKREYRMTESSLTCSLVAVHFIFARDWLQHTVLCYTVIISTKNY